MELAVGEGVPWPHLSQPYPVLTMTSLLIRHGRCQRRLRGLMIALLMLMPMASQAGVAGEEQASRTLGLLQQSIQWIREHHGQPVPATAVSQPESAIDIDTAGQGVAMAAIPLSSAPARETWAGQRFFLRGEDHGAGQTDRVRVGFEESPLPWLNSNLTVDGNWSMSQQPGDTTMDIGLNWRMPLGRNQLAFSGRHHEYQDEAIIDDDIRQVGGTRQTLELELNRNLYQGPMAGLNARMIATDVSNQWFENNDLTGEARQSYTLFRVDGHLEGELPWLSARGGIDLAVETCVSLLEGSEQEACGEQIGGFQRYNLSAGLERNWLHLDWDLSGAYQYTPGELPGWRYMEVGPGMMHGFGGQALRGRQGGWLRLDSTTPSRLLWLPSELRTEVTFSLLRGWAETPEQGLASQATVGEVLWRVNGEHLSGGLRAGTLINADGPGLAATSVPDVSLEITWTL